jgi:hypothetical protein
MEDMTMLELEMVQEQLDYWLTEGGTYTELRRLIEEKIRKYAEAVQEQTYRVVPTELMDNVRYLDMYGNALHQLERYKVKHLDRSTEEVTTLETLLMDYGRYAGHTMVDDQTDVENPMMYLESFMEAAYQPPREVCQAFLREFYHTHVVSAWTRGIAWDEDEPRGTSGERGVIDLTKKTDIPVFTDEDEIEIGHEESLRKNVEGEWDK